MKRNAIFAILALLACVCGVILLLPWPTAGLENAMALNSDGTATLVRNVAGASSIFQINRENRVTAAYRERNRRNGDATAISHAAADGSTVYFIRQRGKQTSGSFERWELVKLDLLTNTAETVWLSDTKVPAVSSLSVDSGAVYWAVATEAPATELYRFTPKEGLVQLSTTALPNGQEVRAIAVVSGNSVCALLANGELLRCIDGRASPLDLTSFGAISALSASGSFLWMYDAEHSAIVSGVGSRFSSVVAPSGVLSGVGTGPENLFLRVAEEDGAVLLRQAQSGAFEPVRITAPLGLRFLVRLPLLAAAEAAVLALLLLPWLFFRLVFRGTRLNRRLLAICVFTALAVCTALFVLAIWLGGGLQDEQTLAKAALLSESLENNPSADFAFYAVEGESALPAACRGAALSGSPAVRQLVSKALSEGGQQLALTQFLGRRAAVSATAYQRYGVVTGVLVSAVVTPDLFVLLRGTLQAAGLASALLLLFSVSASYLLLRAVTRPVKEIADRMDELSMGNVRLKDVACGNDEIGRMWRCMRELSVGMGIKDYETRATLESCRRFVPHGLDRLLGHVTEVHFGDSTSVDGDVGFLSVNNEALLREQLSDDQFINFVNLSFSHISKSIRSFGGIFLTTGFDLKAVKVLYPSGRNGALLSGLALLGEKTDFAVGVLPIPQFFVLLHSTRFLYGIVGASDEAFPYVASAEMDFFSGYLKHFAAAGCRLVVTDAYRQKLSGSYSTRHIGFIASEGQQFRYTLYEVLDSYSPFEKNRRAQYDDKFQEAIEKFYHNDFYLACNLFLSLLRICPDDGVARWYLFACEHYFNSTSGEPPNYALFSRQSELQAK